MNQENQNPNIPTPDGNPNELRDTISWVLNVVLKVAAGYLAKVILDALEF